MERKHDENTARSWFSSVNSNPRKEGESVGRRLLQNSVEDFKGAIVVPPA